MGGLINSTTVKGDLWMVEGSTGNMACYPVQTPSEGPGPRVGHSSLLVGNAFIVFGGDTKLQEEDVLDDTLYLLNTGRCRSTLDVYKGSDKLQHPNNGPKHCRRGRDRRDDMDIPSTSWVRKYTSLVVKLRVSSSTI